MSPLVEVDRVVATGTEGCEDIGVVSACDISGVKFGGVVNDGVDLLVKELVVELWEKEKGGTEGFGGKSVDKLKVELEVAVCHHLGAS